MSAKRSLFAALASLGERLVDRVAERAALKMAELIPLQPPPPDMAKLEAQMRASLAKVIAELNSDRGRKIEQWANESPAPRRVANDDDDGSKRGDGD